jgi:hypothetical protein
MDEKIDKRIRRKVADLIRRLAQYELRKLTKIVRRKNGNN